MSFALIAILAAVESYLLGSIPSGVVIGRLFYHADPRDGGSGSIGATNMGRQFGAMGFVSTFLCDMLKGAVGVALARLLLSQNPDILGWQFDLVLIIAVTCAIFGHLYSPWLKFSGGKGISVGFGSILVAFPAVAITILVVFLIFALPTRTISIGSIAAAISFPFAAAFWEQGSVPVVIFSIVVAVFVVYAHRSNIKRILAGEESKFSFHRDR